MNDVTMTTEGLQPWLDESPFIAFLALSCEQLDIEDRSVVLKMPLRPELERGPGSDQFHGGPIASLVDTAGDVAIMLAVGSGVPTVNIRVDYLRPSTGPYLMAHAKARRTGRSIGVADIDVFDQQGRLTAMGRGTYSTIPG